LTGGGKRKNFYLQDVTFNHSVSSLALQYPNKIQLIPRECLKGFQTNRVSFKLISSLFFVL